MDVLAVRAAAQARQRPEQATRPTSGWSGPHLPFRGHSLAEPTTARAGEKKPSGPRDHQGPAPRIRGELARPRA